VNVYAPGTFTREYLQLDSTITSGALSQDFMTATGAGSGWPDMQVDAAVIPLYNGTLVNTDAVLTPFAAGDVELLYTHHGSPGSLLEGKPVGWRHSTSGYGLAVFDFPLYYMTLSAARTALTRVLEEFGEPAGVEPEAGLEIPVQFRLYQNYPNPFNPSTEIRVDIPSISVARVTVYNTLGQRVKVLLNEQLMPGVHRLTWDGVTEGGQKASSGAYFMELVATDAGGRDRFRDIRGMILLK